jgi:hypothetical protein
MHESRFQLQRFSFFLVLVASKHHGDLSNNIARICQKLKVYTRTKRHKGIGEPLNLHPQITALGIYPPVP